MESDLGNGGLSPRVRGNLPDPYLIGWWLRSIPASAGEPNKAMMMTFNRRVYPRECGGTVFAKDPKEANRGLSPRVRGNQCQGRRRSEPAGSIPASAGEPQTRK